MVKMLLTYLAIGMALTAILHYLYSHHVLLAFTAGFGFTSVAALPKIKKYLNNRL